MKNSKSKRFNFPNAVDNEIYFGKKIIQISSSSDGSFICGSTSSFLFKINYEILIQKLKNKTIEKDYNYKNLLLLEMHPSYDKKTFLLCSNQKDILIINFKNEIDLITKITNDKFSTINFIQWQNKNNNILVISSDKKIFIYEKDTLISIIEDEENPYSMKFLCITNSKLEEFQMLITGYNGIIKFWDFSDEIPKMSYCTKNVLKNNIDIIEGNNNGCLILIGSKESRILENYEFTRVKIFFVFEFQIPEEGGKIINVSFIKKEGIVVSCELCFYLYYINDRKIFFEQCITFDKKIDLFKVYNNYLNTKDFFIYTRNTKLFAKEFKFDNHDLHISSCINNLFNNEINDIQKFYFHMKNKEDIIIDKINQKCFEIEIKDIKFQLQFFEKKIIPISIKNERYELNEILRQSIQIFDKNKNPNKSIMKLIDELINIIKSNSSPKNIVPYIKTCTFTWTLDGKIILFKNNQIDFKQLKQNDKEITSLTHLKNFVKFCVDKNPSIKQIQNNDKLIEEDDEEINHIVSLPLSKVINWEFSFERGINEILNYLNHSQSLPSIFVNKSKSKNEIENKNILINYEPPQRTNTGASNELNNKQKKLFYDINNYEFKMNILNKLEIHIFSKETLNNLINSIIDKNNCSELSVLICLLKQINYNINLILHEKNYVLINLYRQDLLNLLINLEKKKNYEYLFICIVVIIKRIYSDIIDSYNFNSTDDKKSNNVDDNISRSSKYDFKKVKSNSLINDPSFSNISESPTKNNNSEMINENNENILIGSTNNNESIELDYDSYDEYEFLSNNHEKLNFTRNKSKSFDLNKLDEKDNNNNISITSYQIESKFKTKDMNAIFDNQIKNNLLLYLYYFANELLFRKNRVSESGEIIQFLKLISYLKE